MVSISASAHFLTIPGTTNLFVISPGRFFAVNEVKLLLAHLLATYDMKFEIGKEAPPDIYIASLRIPRSTGVMFRKRQ